MRYRFEQVDVFTQTRFAGNPLAVFTDASGLTREQMQQIAREMNLSETTFVVPSTRDDCVVRYHIFTPGKELPFAGHPTLGTAYVLARSRRIKNGATTISMEAKVGPVAVRVEGPVDDPEALYFTSPEVIFSAKPEDRVRVAEALGISEADLLPGAPLEYAGCPVLHLNVGLKTPKLVDQVRMNSALLGQIMGDVSDGVYVFAPSGAPNRFYTRALFLENVGVAEDPATGSAASPLGAYLVRHDLVSGQNEVEIVIEQGVKMGRRSLINVRVARDGAAARRVEVGGSVVSVLTGELTV